MYNNGYEGDDYTVETPAYDIDSSGSWGKWGRWLVLPSANQREDTRREREGTGQRAKES